MNKFVKVHFENRYELRPVSSIKRCIEIGNGNCEVWFERVIPNQNTIDLRSCYDILVVSKCNLGDEKELGEWFQNQGMS